MNIHGQTEMTTSQSLEKTSSQVRYSDKYFLGKKKKNLLLLYLLEFLKSECSVTIAKIGICLLFLLAKLIPS